MLTTIAIVVVAAIAFVLVLASTKSDVFHVERSTSIAAPPERIFPFINDFHAWTAWSPYEDKDPAMQRTYGPVTVGKGATYAWSGNSNVGVGRMSIADAVPPGKVHLDLEFDKPFRCRNTVEFTLETQGAETRVTWCMRGPANFVSKIMQVFMNMDHMVGRDFETGLARLKAVAERPTAA